jgi:hypothetical protein
MRQTSREHWVTSTLALHLWCYAEAAEWDGMLSHNSNAWISHHWTWSRPRLRAAVLRVTRWVSRWAWRWCLWHMARPRSAIGDGTGVGKGRRL